ncbi:hypothetical protein WA158_006473 [Blastocystis sp. Blastoise]
MQQFIPIISSPYDYLNSMFENACKSNNGTVPEGDWGIQNMINVYVNNPELYQLIPSLDENKFNASKIPINSLIRFRGQVSDIRNQDIYCRAYYDTNMKTNEKVVRTGKYRDTLPSFFGFESDLSFEHCLMGGRDTLVLEPVPGENNWLSKQYDSLDWIKRQVPSNTVNKNKRSMVSEDVDIKKSLQEYSMEIEVDKDTVATNQNQLNPISTNENVNNKNTIPGQDTSFTVPPSRPAKPSSFPVLARFYDGNEDIHINDIIEVIGIYTLTEDNYGLEEEETSSITHLTPDIHVLTYFHQSIYYPYTYKTIPHTPISLSSEHQYGSEQLFQFQQKNPITILRSNIIKLFTEFFRGDNLMAEYFLLHLISHADISPPNTLFFSFPLNIYNADEELCQAVQYLSSELMTSSVYLPLLPDRPLSHYISIKDHTTNRLQKGLLQLCNNTNLILQEQDDSFIHIPSLCGILNMLIDHNQLEYDFKYFTKPFEHYIPICILSQKQSKLTSIPLPHIPSDSPLNSTKYLKLSSFLQESDIQAIRQYICIIKQLQFSMNDDSLINEIQDRFVQIRQHQQFTPEELHLQLTMFRLYSLSCGIQQGSIKEYNIVEALEKTRKARLP